MASFLSSLRDEPAPSATDASPASIEEALVVGEDGTWFAIGEVRVDLAHRKPLARVLRAMATRAHLGEAYAAMTRAELVEAGWPGERMLPRSSRIRLRVAIATLRALGLADRIRTTRAGYGLRGPVRIAMR